MKLWLLYRLALFNSRFARFIKWQSGLSTRLGEWLIGQLNGYGS